MIGGPARHLRLNSAEPQLAQIKRFSKGIDHPDRIVLSNKIFKTFGEKARLIPINAFNKSLHNAPD